MRVTLADANAKKLALFKLQTSWGWSFNLVDPVEEGNRPKLVAHLAVQQYKSTVWYVATAAAKNGYGPLIYDIAMRHVTDNLCWLTCDRGMVSKPATKVWEFYYNNRTDVIKEKLLSPHRQKPFMDCVNHKYKITSQVPTATLEANTKLSKFSSTQVAGAGSSFFNSMY